MLQMLYFTINLAYRAATTVFSAVRKTKRCRKAPLSVLEGASTQACKRVRVAIGLLKSSCAFSCDSLCRKMLLALASEISW